LVSFNGVLMPLHIADPDYLSFEKLVCRVVALGHDRMPEAARRGMAIQGMKNFADAKLLQSFRVHDCLRCVLSLPIHCTVVGCTMGQLEDDVRIVKQFNPGTCSRGLETDIQAPADGSFLPVTGGLDPWVMVADV